MGASSSKGEDHVRRISDALGALSPGNAPSKTSLQNLLAAVQSANADVWKTQLSGTGLQALVRNLDAEVQAFDQTNHHPLFESFDQANATRLQTARARLLQLSKQAAMSPEDLRSLDSFVSDVVALQGRHAFFQYRYVQLSLFLVSFVEQAYEAMQALVDDVRASASASSDDQRHAVHELVDMLSKSMASSSYGTRADPNDVAALDALASQLASRNAQLMAEVASAGHHAQGAIETMLTPVPPRTELTGNVNENSTIALGKTQRGSTKVTPFNAVNVNPLFDDKGNRR
jgi:hypothetical protein